MRSDQPRPAAAHRGALVSAPPAWSPPPLTRRIFERTPLGVPITAGIAAAGIAAGAVLGVVPDGLAWEVGGPLALLAEAFGFYAWIALRRARRGDSVR